MAQSGICDAICNVKEDELEEIEDLVADLTRQLRVAVGVRDALSGKTTLIPTPVWDVPQQASPPSEEVQPATAPTRRKPGRKPRQVPEEKRQPRAAKAPIEATEKTLQIGRLLHRRGPLTKEAIADSLGLKFAQVAMTIGRSARHFTRLDDGRFDVAPALAKLL